MDAKAKEFMRNYKPENVSDITYLRNRKPLWSQNTIRKMPMKRTTEPLTYNQSVDVLCLIATIVFFLWIALNN